MFWKLFRFMVQLKVRSALTLGEGITIPLCTSGSVLIISDHPHCNLKKWFGVGVLYQMGIFLKIIISDGVAEYAYIGRPELTQLSKHSSTTGVYSVVPKKAHAFVRKVYI